MRYSKVGRQDILSTITTDAVAVLINAPIYGGTSPNETQLAALDSITMLDVVKYELQGTYSRYVIPTVNTTEEVVGGQTYVVATVPIEFTCAITNATHICYVYNALLVGANQLNYNNRGNVQGVPLLVKPIANAPVTITPPAKLTYTFNIRIGSNG
jgi:hypothetical protein